MWNRSRTSLSAPATTPSTSTLPWNDLPRLLASSMAMLTAVKARIATTMTTRPMRPRRSRWRGRRAAGRAGPGLGTGRGVAGGGGARRRGGGRAHGGGGAAAGALTAALARPGPAGRRRPAGVAGHQVGRPVGAGRADQADHAAEQRQGRDQRPEQHDGDLLGEERQPVQANLPVQPEPAPGLRDHAHATIPPLRPSGAFRANPTHIRRRNTNRPRSMG